MQLRYTRKITYIKLSNKCVRIHKRDCDDYVNKTPNYASLDTDDFILYSTTPLFIRDNCEKSKFIYSSYL